MTKQLIYSILHYKHSLVLGESLNVGILFSFPDEDKIQFVVGNTKRVKCVYPEFDSSIFNSITSKIKTRAIYKDDNSLLSGLVTTNYNYKVKNKESLKEYINNFILNEDSTSLQFSDIYTAVNVFENSQQAIEQFTKILLPNTDIKKEIDRHNENYIKRRFLDCLIKRDINPEHRLSYNKHVATKSISLNFELAWKNGITHLVKPLSFDLTEGTLIQNKSVTYFGYLNLLNDYAKLNKCTFDLLLSKPQDEKLVPYYNNALDILNDAKAPKTIITDETFEDYSDETAKILITKGIDD